MNKINNKQLFFLGIICGIVILQLITLFSLDEGSRHLFTMGILIINLILLFKFRPKRLMTYSRTELQHLRWVYNRLKHVYKEDSNNDYMIKLKSIIDKIQENGKVSN